MKLLLSGATGFIGQNLSKKLLAENHDVYAIVRPKTKLDSFGKRIKVFIYDGNIIKLISFMQDQKIEGVIHLASLFLV